MEREAAADPRASLTSLPPSLPPLARSPRSAQTCARTTPRSLTNTSPRPPPSRSALSQTDRETHIDTQTHSHPDWPPSPPPPPIGD
eukprot:414775-Rhodomonas_salina.1